MKSLFSFYTSFFFLSFALAQAPCGLNYFEKQFLNQHPNLEKYISDEKQKLEDKYQSDLLQKASGPIYTIPVVFHILHENGPENISDEQVYDAMRILNEDFRKTNADFSNVISQFSGIAADAEIQFKLAQKDPQGNCTKGINRWQTPLTSNAGDNSKIQQWPRNKYLNIWVVRTIDAGASGGITLGYTYYPSIANFNPSIDGIIVRHTAVGTIGSSNSDGKTLTHEVGHWINLPHTWGNGEVEDPTACSDDDGVADTPNCIGNFGGCNSSSSSCGTLDNVQNFMNYASCTHMFTQGQATRMRSALTSSVAGRNNLWSASNLQATGTDGNDNLCLADFRPSSYVGCVGDTIVFNDLSYHNPSTWNWSTSASNSTFSSQNPEVILENTGFANINLTVENTSGSLSLNKNNIIRVIENTGSPAPISEDFSSVTIPSLEWDRIDVTNDNTSWETSSVGYNSTGSVWLNNFSVTGQEQFDELISPLFDLGNMTFASVSFKAAFARKITANQDKLNAYYSPDCGKTWILKLSRAGSSLMSVQNTTSNFVPQDSTEWKSFSFSIASQELSSFGLIKFEFESDGGNNIYIDNLNIDGLFSSEPVLESPSNLALLQQYSVTLDWKALNDPVDSYEYQLDTTPSFNSPFLQEGSKNYIDNTHNNIDTEYEVPTALSKGITYYWRVRAIESFIAGNWSPTWSFQVDPLLSQHSFAYDNKMMLHPNPASEWVQIMIQLKDNQSIEIDLFDVFGKKIESIFSGSLPDSKDVYASGFSTAHLASGIYILRLKGQKGSFTKKLIIE